MAFGRKSIYKLPRELRAMLLPSEINQQAFAAVLPNIQAGVTTLELNAIADETIRAAGARPNFAEVPGYKHAICANVNDTVVHGIPDDRKLEPGDMVTIDCGAVINGWHSDAARTVIIPDPTRPELVASRQKLSDVTEEAMWAGIARLATAKGLNQVGVAIEKSIRDNSNYGICDEYIGHGIGQEMHEDPPVFNYTVKGAGPAVRAGLVVCIEPIITEGSPKTIVMSDGWTVKTADGKDACQWEQTVMVHGGGIWVPTEADGGASRLAAYNVTPVSLQS